MIAATAGTPFAPSFAGSLVVLEDVDEPIYRLDRMLTHLHLSGILRGARGLVFGPFGEVASDLSGGCADDGSWAGVVADAARRSALPTATGLSVGHRSPNLTLPLGVIARLDASKKTLELGE